LTRRFYNKSAAPITITELGLTAYISSTTYVLLAYDVLDTPYSFVNDTYVYFSIVLSDSVTYDIMPNFFKSVYLRLTNITVQVVDTSNLAKNITSLNVISCTSPAGNNNYGIQIGSGTASNTSSTYIINTNLLLPTNTNTTVAINNNMLTAYR